MGRSQNGAGRVVLIVISLWTWGAGVGADAAEPVRHEVIVDAPVAEVWKALTTREGIESWMVPHGEIDLRVGGKMRTHYQPDGVLGDPNTIENTILSYEPMRMLSIKATKAPENFPFKVSLENMWSVLYFDPVDARRTRVTCVGMGYGDDDESKGLRAHFEKGNAYTLEKLRERFASEATASEAEEIERLLHSLLGGEWSFENSRPDGKVFRGRMIAESIMDGKFIITHCSLGGAEALSPHGHTLHGRDPLTGGMRAWDFGQGGSVSGGPMSLMDGNRVVYDWVQTDGGRTRRYYVEDVYESSDAMRAIIYELLDGEPFGVKPRDRQPIVNLLWKRSPAGSGSAGAETPSASPSVKVRSEGKRLDKEIVVEATLKDAWEAWTTNQGVQTFFAPDSNIDLRAGGAYEILFSKDAPKGTRGAEDCHVLSVLPRETLAFSWSAPPQWPEIRNERTTVVLRFEDLGHGRVRVRLTHCGFGDSADWEAVRSYFDSAWTVVLGRLQERFAKGPLDWKALSGS